MLIPNVPQPSYAATHGKDGMQSVFIDDYQASFRGDFWERPGLLSFEQLRSMTAQMPVLNAVVMTRTRQVQRFCRVSEKDNTLPGFEIRHRDRKHQITDAEQKKLQDVAMFMSNCGSETLARQRKALRRDSFPQFMGKITRDSLILDSVGIETEWRNDKKLGLNGLYAVDGATIRLCSEEGYRGDPDIYAVQVVNGRIRTAYTFEDLIYEPRNPRADVSCAGYGLPETELLIRLVTGFLNAMSLNNNVFDKNSIPKGVLHLFGNYSDEDMAAFRRYWSNMSRGVNNAFAMPILASKDQESAVKFEKFGVDFSEMMFAKWMTFLTSLICAIYGMSPSEINFDSFTGGTTSALGGNDTAEKLAASKDSGLRPLLSYFENLLTDYVVSELDNDFCFRWTGLDVEDQDKKYELRKTLLTLNELRAEEGYDKIDGVLGDAPVEASLLNAWMQLQAAQQPEDGQGEDGDKQADGTLRKANSHHDPLGRFAPVDSEAVLLAPNGKPSNLNAMQWAQVRTPAFKKWFGDWMYNPDMEMTPIKLIDNTAMPDLKDTAGLRRYLKNTLQGRLFANQQTGNEIKIFASGIEATLKNRNTQSRRLFAILPQMLQQSAYAGYEENTKTDIKPHIKGYETYYAVVDIDGKPHSVRLLVDIVNDDSRGRGYYYHQINEMDLGGLVGKSRSQSNDNQTNYPKPSGFKIILSQLTGKDKADASKYLDENREPFLGNTDEHPFFKAHSHDTPHDIFKPHENPFIRGLVEDYYESGMIRLSAVRIALNQWLAGLHYAPGNGLTIPSELLYSQSWTDGDAATVESYLSGIDPDEFGVNDLSLLAKLLVRQNLPENVLVDEAINHASQSYMMGAAQSAWEAKNPDSAITDVQVAALRTALPTALEGVVTAMRLSGMAKATLDYGAARAAENIVALTDDARAKIQGVLMDNALKRLSGDTSATAKKLEQTLGDKFGDMNRDWRRIALTETGEMSLQGFVANQPIGAKLKRLEQYDGACSFCRKIDGTVVTVVDPEASDKDGKTQIWQGKTNIGRSSSPRKRTDEGLVDREEHELWWLATGVIHPHCRGRWVGVRSGNVQIPGL